jgi:ATP-binding protein involved in chromosome partitioning
MKLNDVPTTILVASGKGGVGKTTVASDLARTASDRGLTVGLIDADISTPNTPEVVGGEDVDFGGQRLSTHDAIVPAEADGIQLISQGMALPDDVPVLRGGSWRAEAVADYIGHVEWDDDTDVVFIDTPPGTGEELQVIASEAPVDHAFVVTTPHPSSVRDATKTHEFFVQADVPHECILNMAYIPGQDIAHHVTEATDFTTVEQVGEARAEEIADHIREETPDYNLFGYDPDGSIDLNMDITTVVPYTQSFSYRQASYDEAVNSIVGAEEVEA